MTSSLPVKKRFILVSAFLLVLTICTQAQMRQVHMEADEDNEVYGISFFSPSQGFVAFNDWVGYSTDSGRTFTQKPITLSNVDFNGYTVNVTFGFVISDIKAFNANNIVVSGHYGLVPAILRSTNGGTTYKLVFHSQFNPLQLRTGITDMVFPTSTVGYAVDADRVLKTTDAGENWTVVRTDAGRYYEHIEALDADFVYAMTGHFLNPLAFKSTNGGSTWQIMSLPSGHLNYLYFFSSTIGWINLDDKVYYTSNGGSNWTLKNNVDITPFDCDKMRFINDSTGFALSGLFEVYKTTDAGKVWEPMPADNNFTHLGYTHNDLQILNANQIWAGGGHGFLEINTNASARPVPQAYFKIDTAGLYIANQVNLINFSRPFYQYKWLVNGVQVSTSYNATYTHDIYLGTDTVSLVVTDGVYSDTTTLLHYFDAVPYPAPLITSFTPASGGTGTTVIITGNFFANVSGVSFGGIPASSYTVNSLTQVTAVVGAGGNGSVTVTSATGTGSLPGFITFPPPAVTSIAPLSGPIGTIVTVTGQNFSATPANNIVYVGGVKVNVLTATTTQLTIAIPPGGGDDLISVTINNHTAYSNRRFTVTFPGYCGLSTFSFAPSRQFQSEGGGHNIGNMTVYDLDGDGKKDVIQSAWDDISVMRNTSTPGNINFAERVFLFAGRLPDHNAISDFDGDGKPDIAVPVQTLDTIVVFKNNCLPGTIAFTQVLKIPTLDAPTGFSANDFDGDGKPDMAVVNSGPNVRTLSIYRNISINGNIAVAPRVDLEVGVYAGKICIADFDGDNKPDIVVRDHGILNSGIHSFTVYHNTSSIGAITFEGPIEVLHYTYGLGDMTVSDVDGDGKADITITYDTRYTLGNPDPIAIYRSTSTPGNISFAAPVPIDALFSWSQAPSYGDLDGDGKVDLFYTDGWTSPGGLFKNNSTPGNISMENVGIVPIPGSSSAYDWTSIADIDNDGRPDLLGGGGLYVHRNVLEPNTWAGKDTTICSGQTVIIGGYTNDPGTGYTVSWTSSPAGFTSTLAKPVVNPTVTTTYYVSVTNPAGCTVLDTIQVTVGGPAPTINAGADRYICKDDVTVIGSPATAGNTYSWTSFPVGYTSTVANPGVSPTTNTSYYLTVNTGSCVAKDTVTVNVWNRPVANAGVDRSVCSPFGTTLGTTGSSFDTYQWTSDPAGFTSSSAMPYVAPSVTTTYFLTVTNMGNCSSKDTVVVTVLPSPPVPTITASGPVALCTGGSVTLTSSSATGNVWKNNGGTIPGATDQTLLVTTAGSYTVQNTLGTCVSVSAPTVVTVSAAAAAPVITAGGGDTLLCQGESVTITSSLPSGNQWYKDGVLIPGATNPAYVANAGGVYTAKNISTSCTSNSSNPITVVVTAMPATPVVTAGGSTTFCSGGNVTLSSSAASGNQWYRNGTPISGAVGQNYSAANDGSYTVRVSNTGCVSGISNTIQVTVNASPAVPTITANGNVLSSSASSGNQWNFNGSPISGATNQTYTAIFSGLYTVQVTVNGCSAVSLPHNLVVTGIVVPAWNENITIAPNPVIGDLHIKYNGNAAKFEVSVMDMNGKAIVDNINFQTSCTIDLRKYTPGIYLVRIVNIKNGEHVQRIIMKSPN